MHPRDLPEQYRRQFEAYPPSAKLVYIVLVAEGPMTQGQLAEETMLPPRTVRSALDRLERDGFISGELYIPDARKTVFDVTVADSPDTS
jgi:DNA-binding MarR family transcriptional regulator